MVQGTYVRDEMATGSTTYSNLDKVCPVWRNRQRRCMQPCIGLLIRARLVSCLYRARQLLSYGTEMSPCLDVLLN